MSQHSRDTARARKKDIHTDDVEYKETNLGRNAPEKSKW